MHELSTVEELVSHVRHAAGGRRVLEVLARCPVGVEHDEITACFSYIVSALGTGDEGRWLASAHLVLETMPVRLSCTCGYEGELGSEDVAGHIGICPRCGCPRELDASLVLVGISLAPDDRRRPVGGRGADGVGLAGLADGPAGPHDATTLAPAQGDQLP